jgi:hypothetical protein
LDIDESLVRVQVMLPEKWLAKLKETAFEKEVSRGSLIREALRDWFKKIEESTQPNPKAKISDEDLDDILNHCSTFFGGFEIDGEDGFIATMKLNNFKLKELTPEQWERGWSNPKLSGIPKTDKKDNQENRNRKTTTTVTGMFRFSGFWRLHGMFLVCVSFLVCLYMFFFWL